MTGVQTCALPIFVKEGNQNALAEEHVDKIIDTYKSRTTIDKYSYVASLGEVKENDYNLNIPRYVDTFEAEAVVDLAAVSLSLRELDLKLSDADSKIADFCKELGISTPF